MHASLGGWPVQLGSGLGFVGWSLVCTHSCCQGVDFLEFYAGEARTTSFMRYANYSAAKFDIIYYVPEQPAASNRGQRNKNFMDVLSPAGFLCLG